jgi:hypothetical protein
MTITIPPDLEASLAVAAQKQGATPELVAVESLRRLYAPSSAAASGTLKDFLKGYVGTIEGTNLPLSLETGAQFTDLLSQEN